MGTDGADAMTGSLVNPARRCANASIALSGVVNLTGSVSAQVARGASVTTVGRANLGGLDSTAAHSA